MGSFGEPWFYYVLGAVTGIVLFNLGITGKLYGRVRPIITVKSVPLRIAFFVISIAIFAVLIWMVRQQIAAGMQYFGFLAGGASLKGAAGARVATRAAGSG
jgi:uncharacterized membrane protein YvlD (DUF360 family)